MSIGPGCEVATEAPGLSMMTPVKAQSAQFVMGRASLFVYTQVMAPFQPESESLENTSEHFNGKTVSFS